MYGIDPMSDAVRVARAIVTNQIAKLAPGLYIRLTGQTGRGAAPEAPTDIAGYFRRCFNDYFRVLDVAPGRVSDYLNDKRVLEYGPGDVPGVALLMLAHGAQQVYCVDRFSMIDLSEKNVAVLRCLMDELPTSARQVAERCFRTPGDPASGFREDRLKYLVGRTGLSGLRDAVDLVISRAVLEHVNDLSATFADMRLALRPGGIAIHQVDLKSHGLHRRNPLDFLTWSNALWALMYSGKGIPNRWRVDRYRQELADNGLNVLVMRPTALAERRDIDAVRPYLAAPFRNVSSEDLSWLGMWIVCTTPRRS